ncbi:MAG TPA: biotin/lipoyl-containing protein [Thermomonospora sp.]|nr:biotin/lipoyl-containing protein [Thermomonospora sp.]
MDESVGVWQERLRAVREEMGALVRAIPGPVAELVVRVGDCSLEVTWDRAAGDGRVPGDEGGGGAGGGPVGGEGCGDGGPGGGGSREDGVRVCRAPVVGTFYVAPAPGEPPYVRVGDHVEAGQTVGVVEAMKLMNEVPAECSGEVVGMAPDGSAVEFGQELVRIRPGPG